MTARRVWTPREYQALARNFMIDVPRPALWAKPGMGKTGVVYSVLDVMKLAGSNFFPALVLAPKKVCEMVWPAEAVKWDAFADLKCIPLIGDARTREESLLRRGDVYALNYENLPWLIERLGKKWHFKTVVADEATKLKNFRLKGQGGKRATALATIAKQTGRWMNLTGTPSPNGLKDLWGQTWFQDFGERLGSSYTAYMDRWFHVDGYTRVVEPRDGADEEIHAALADITMALRPEDWLDIKAPQIFRRDVELPDDAMRLYKQMERDFFAEVKLGTEIEALNAAAKSMKLLQMSSGHVYDSAHTAHLIHDAKIEELKSIINESGGESILVVFHFQFEATALKAAFGDAFRVFRTARDEADWNAGKIPLMGIHPQSGGHGTNLQYGGRTMVFFTHTWDLELREQVIERIGPVRQLQAGLDRVVLIYDLVARNTLDVDVLNRLTSKRSVQEALMIARAASRGDVYTEQDTAEAARMEAEIRMATAAEASWAGLV